MKTKKIIASVLVLMLSLIMLTGCNYNMIDTKWNFGYAYLTLPDGQVKEIEVKSWTEDELSMTIQGKDGNVYCSSPVNFILSEDRIDEFK